jgi:hypothetical protein
MLFWLFFRHAIGLALFLSKRNHYETFAFVGSITPALRIARVRQFPDVGGLF